MEVLKEYAGVLTALVTVVAALGALGLWAINAQVTPEINRLEGRIDGNQILLRQIDRKIDASVKDRNARFDRLEREMNARFERNDAKFDGIDARFDAIDAKFDAIDAKFDRIDGRLEGIDSRFEGIDAKFDRIDGELKTIRNDIKTILLRLPKKAEAG